jgi:hypothetical protein
MQAANFRFSQRIARAAKWYVHRTILLKLIKFLQRLANRNNLKRRAIAAFGLISSPNVEILAEKFHDEGFVSLNSVIDPTLLADLDCAAGECVRKLASNLIREKESHKTFWTRLIDDSSPDGLMSSNSPFVRFALQDCVLDFMSCAFGEVPLLESVNLTLSRYTEDPLSYSQLWHRDYDDTKVVRLPERDRAAAKKYRAEFRRAFACVTTSFLSSRLPTARRE